MRMAWTVLGLLWSCWAAAQAPPCAVCHADTIERGHAHPVAPALEGSSGAGPACADCHRGAEAHALAPMAGEVRQSMTTFGADGRGAAVCSECHQQVHQSPVRDAHAQAGIACDGCHRVHGTAPFAGTGGPLPAGFDGLDDFSRLCADCHADVLTSFTFNERHRLAEGVVSCVSCHDPHAAAPPALVAHPGDGMCSDCHGDKTGPFVFEHGAQRVEGCEACHEPHGGPNRFLLTRQQEGALCYECHLTVPQFHVGFAPGAPPRFDEDTVCTNCHTAIHGSNLDRNLLR